MSKRKTILAVASAGGHWTQLLIIGEAFKHHDVHYVTTNINTSVILSKEKFSTVLDADLSTKLKLIPSALKMLIIVLRRRPDWVISTGAAPGFFALFFGKMLGAKTIWVDSMANYSKLSVSGQKASVFCDLCITQWPNLADAERIKYFGSLL